MELTIEQALQQGITAHKEGKLQDAERLYRAILQSQPAHPDANHNLGLLAVTFNKTDLALPLFKTALESNPKIEQFWLSYIDALIKEKQFDNAKQVLLQAKKQYRDAGLKGDKVDALEAQLNGTTLSLGSSDTHPSKEQLGGLISLYHQGKLQAALAEGKKLSDEFPRNPHIPDILGAVYSGLGELQLAIVSYKKSIALKPDLAEVYNSLGNTFNSFKRYEDAESCYTRAVRVRPDYATAYNNLGVLLITVSKNLQATQILKKAILIRPNNAHSLSNLGTAFQKAASPEEAITACDKAIIINATLSKAYNNMGNSLNKLCYHEAAIRAYRKSIELQPNDATAYFNLADPLRALNKFNEAISNLRKAIELRPNYRGAWNNFKHLLFTIGPLELSQIETYEPSDKSFSSVDDRTNLAMLKYEINVEPKEAPQLFSEVLKVLDDKTDSVTKNKNFISEGKKAHQTPKVVSLLHFGRSGTGLLHSLLDNHPQISTLPSIYFSEFFDSLVWESLTAGGWNEIPDRFIAMYPVLFNAASSTAVRSLSGISITNLGTKEGMTSLGENKDEVFTVDENKFRQELISQIARFDNLNPMLFFKLVHAAFDRALGDSNQKKIIFYHLHNPSCHAKLNFARYAQKAQLIVMIREPLQSCESWVHQSFRANDYMGVTRRIVTMLLNVDDYVYQYWKAVGVRLEDLKQYPEKTIPALCDWMGIKETPSLYEMTAQGKKWWGDPSSPNFTKDGMLPFSTGPIEREIGHIFTDYDQFILKTLFYPFSTKFGYQAEDSKHFFQDLKKIKPLLSEPFDFEKQIAKTLDISIDSLKASSDYLYLRSGIISRWNCLNQFGTYPNMLQPLQFLD